EFSPLITEVRCQYFRQVRHAQRTDRILSSQECVAGDYRTMAVKNEHVMLRGTLVHCPLHEACQSLGDIGPLHRIARNGVVVTEIRRCNLVASPLRNNEI